MNIDYAKAENDGADSVKTNIHKKLQTVYLLRHTLKRLLSHTSSATN